MLRFTNEPLFDDVVETAMRRAHTTCSDEHTRDRWVFSIVKAVAFLRSAELHGLEWNATREALYFHAPTENITVTDRSCECPAASQGLPCYHRAMVRLVKRYYERENANEIVATMPIDWTARNGELVECASGSCGWRGWESELLWPPTVSAEADVEEGFDGRTVIARYREGTRQGICPKCESDDIGAVPTTAMVLTIPQAHNAEAAAARGGAR